MDVAFQGTINFGGVGRFTTELVQSLSSHVDSITVCPTPLSVENPCEHPYWRTIPENVKILQTTGYVSTFLRDCKVFQEHDIAHVNYGTFGMAAFLSKFFADTPYVFTVHSSQDLEFEEFGMQTWLLEYLLERRVCLPLLESNGQFVTVSKYNKLRLQEEHGTSASVVYHGIRPDNHSESGKFDRSRYDIDEDSNIVLSVGRFYPSKGMRTVVDSFPALRRDTVDNTELVIVGGGPLEDDLRDRVGPRDRSDVHFLSNLSDKKLKELYADSTLFTLPSTSESFGIVYLEAMAAGLPIVYAEAGASPEIVGNTGISVPAGDPEALSNSLTNLLNDADWRDKLAANCRQRADLFNWEWAAQKYANIYERQIGSQKSNISTHV